MKEVFVDTEDGVKIAFNLYKCGHDEVVIICPGWYMTKDSSAFLSLAEKITVKYDVISIDFRGHGKSSGFFTFTSKEIFDLDAVVNYAKENYKKIYLMGFSLGGAMVLIYGAIRGGADKIIAVSAPSDFYKIENRMWHPNAWIPTFKKFEPKRWISIRPSLIIHKKIKPADIVEQINVPTLFVAGKKDVTVCPWHTELLYKKAKCEKKFELFENGIHAEDLFLSEPDRFLNLCFDWLDNR